MRLCSIRFSLSDLVLFIKSSERNQRALPFSLLCNCLNHTTLAVCVHSVMRFFRQVVSLGTLRMNLGGGSRWGGWWLFAYMGSLLGYAFLIVHEIALLLFEENYSGLFCFKELCICQSKTVQTSFLTIF